MTSPAQLAAIFEREGLDPAFRPALGRLLLTYKNIADAVTQGLELDGEVALSSQASIGVAYTYLDAKDTESDLELTGRHSHQGHIRFGYQVPRIGLTANLRGTFYSDWIAARGASDTVAPGFALWDLYMSQRVVSGLSAFAAIDNLADSQDPNTGVLAPSGSPASIYRPEAGRTVRVGLRWSWARQ